MGRKRIDRSHEEELIRTTISISRSLHRRVHQIAHRRGQILYRAVEDLLEAGIRSLEKEEESDARSTDR